MPFRLSYRPALDGLRGLAVLAVVGYHNHVPALPGGFLGVDVFFVLSGFLITSLLVEEWATTGGVSLGRFYLRRALRLFPALWLTLAAVAPFVPLGQVLPVLLYFGNWPSALGLVPTGPLTHTWSLAVEEQFYLLWPAVLLVALRTRLSRLWLAAVPLGLAAASALHRGWLWGATGSWSRSTFGSDGHADGLLLGAGLALALGPGRLAGRPWLRRVLPFAGYLGLGFLVPAAVLPSDQGFWATAGLALAGIAAALVVWAVVEVPRGALARSLASPPLVFVGRVSYGLYLYHWPVTLYFVWRGVTWPLLPALAVPPSLALAVASYYWIERPILRLKDRVWRAAPSGPPVAPLRGEDGGER